MTLLAAMRLACAVALRRGPWRRAAATSCRCGGTTAAGAAQPTADCHATATSAAPKPQPKPAAVNPLTGGEPITGRVIAVKIDDTDTGRPQVGHRPRRRRLHRTGRGRPDPAAGGVLHAHAADHRAGAQRARQRPGDPGPVRPDRLRRLRRRRRLAADPGRVAPEVGHQRPRRTRASSATATAAMPYNLMLNTSEVPARSGKQAQSIGWTWNRPRPSSPARRAAGSLHTVIGGTGGATSPGTPRAGATSASSTASSQHAADGVLLTTPNVIVQFCSGTPNPQRRRRRGQPGHFTKTVGSGKVVVYRNGRTVTGTWSRPTANAPGRCCKDAHGHVDPAGNPGGAWVLLVTNGTPLS